ncbi:MAG: hypothetical protein E7464_04605 [Ruminococcaceae bacterium]|nr:hypothetical protein [Oscillospiraceae bacterium]
MEIRKIKSNLPVAGWRRGLDRAKQLFLPTAKMQTNLQQVAGKRMPLRRKCHFANVLGIHRLIASRQATSPCQLPQKTKNYLLKIPAFYGIIVPAEKRKKKWRHYEEDF